MKKVSLLFCFLLVAISNIAASEDQSDVCQKTDVTELLSNPDFEEGASGWTIVGSAGIAATADIFGYNAFHFIENYVYQPDVLSDVSWYQTIEVPNGVYVIKSMAHAIQQKDVSQVPSGVFIYANNDEIAVTTTYTNPPAEYSVATIVTDGKLTIGFRIQDCNVNWAAWDNVRVTQYLGKTEEIAKFGWIKDELEAITEKVDELLSSVIQRSIADELQANIDVVAGITTYADGETLLATINENIKKGNASKVAYAALLVALDEAYREYDEGYDNGFIEGLDEFRTAILTAQSLYDNPTGSIDDVEAAITQLYEQILTFQKLNTPEGTEIDVTNRYIINPTMRKGSNGWEGSRPGLEYEVMEFYDCDFNMYQTLTNLPQGMYVVKVQGFYRVGGNDGGAAYNDGSEDITAELYANNESLPLLSLYKYPASEMGVTNTEILNDYINMRISTNEAFNIINPVTAELYYAENEVSVLVLDGTLTIGLRNTGHQTYSWCAFREFKLYYCGEASDEELKEAWETSLQRANEMSRVLLPGDSKGIEDAIAAAVPLAEAGLYVDACETLDLAIAASENIFNITQSFYAGYYKSLIDLGTDLDENIYAKSLKVINAARYMTDALLNADDVNHKIFNSLNLQLGSYVSYINYLIEAEYVLATIKGREEEDINIVNMIITQQVNHLVKELRPVDDCEELLSKLKLTIQALENGEELPFLPVMSAKLTISLPVEHYKGMYIELRDENNVLLSRFLISDKSSLIFELLTENIYNVYIRNTVGAVLGTIEGVVLTDEDMTVTFDSLLPLQNIAVNIFTHDGSDVTAESALTWYDANGSYLCKGATLSGQVEETEVKYLVKLPKELAMQYMQPEQTTYKVKSSDNNIMVVLEPFASTEITGVVRDSTTNIPISNAMVTFSQKLNGEYAHITRVETDSKGAFKANIYDVPTDVTVAAADYISYTLSLDTLTEPTALGEILMKPISGVVVSVGFTYRTSVPDGDTPEILGWYTDYDNVKYGILNKTTGLPVSNFSVQYPQLVLLDGVSEGDELLLTVVSRTNSFEPTQTTAVVDSALRCDATFDIVELGGIKASYTTTGNSAVVGILYNEAGELLQKRSYASGSLTFDNLRDGVYTLVTMGSSDYFNAIYSLSQLAAVGLVEGADYVMHAVTVESGVLSIVEIESVPTFDESKLYYTGGDTRFTVNKTSATAGNYLTLTGKIDFKAEYASKVSNVSMVIDIPESAVFVDNSVMVGTAVVGYVMEGNRLTISLSNNYTERVRFCIIPTEGGSYAPNAFAQFTIDGKEVLQPIGSAHYTIKDLSIGIPSVTSKATIPVSGMAIANSTIQIYDNDVLIGETTSLANGAWNSTCDLYNPYNLSTHRIHAVVTTKQGLKFPSEWKECIYDMNAIEVSKVTMVNVAHPANSLVPCEYVTVFDFLHPTKSVPDYWYWPDYPEFTFLIEFTDNDTTKVSNVVLWVETCNGNQVPLNAEYDENKGLWVASGKFGNWSNYDIPANVSLDFDAKTERIIDYEQIQDLYRENALRPDLDSIDLNHLKFVEIIDKYYLNKISIETYEEYLESYYSSLEVDNIESDSSLFVYLHSLSREQLMAFSDSILLTSAETKIDILDYFSDKKDLESLQALEFFINGSNISYTKSGCEDLNSQKLLLEGFVSIPTSSGDSIYVKSTEFSFEVVDFASNQYLKHLYSENDAYAISNTRSVYSMYDNALNKLEVINTDLTKYSNDLLSVTKEIEHFFSVKYNELLSKAKALRIVAKTNRDIGILEGAGELLEDAKACELAAAKLEADAARLQKWTANVKVTTAATLGNIVNLATSASSLYQDVKKWLALNNEINNRLPCKGNEVYANSLNSEVHYYGSLICIGDVLTLSGAVVSIGATVVSLMGIVPSGGLSSVGAGAGVVGTIGSIVVGHIFQKVSESHYNRLNGKIKSLKCDINEDNNNDDKNADGDGGKHKSNNPPTGGVHDPSGYVYEGVSSNRLEGVMASCYYKETVEDIYGDLHENVVLWDAEEYAQENPLFTDANGMYRWDVPKGLWQVKFEKEGYETTFSEWLPVPPPQLEVNIPMVQNKQPEVADVHAYKDGVEIEFDKYMQPATLNTDNIFVTQNDEKVAGTVTLLNEEVAYEGQSETYVSKVRFVFDQAVTAKEITLTVVNSVKSYAGLQMQDTYTQTFAIEQEVEGIVADSLVSMYYGGEHTLTVKVIPAAAAAGKTLLVTSSSPMILGVDTDSIVLDNSGEAVLTVSGELPGMGAISYSLVGYDYRASTLVEVVYNNTKMTANPTASIASGTTVAKGTEVTLSCTTEGAAIYYTLDGSCPCDDTAILYDGTPIVINENTELRIMAVAEGMYESDVVVYNYYVEGADVEEVTLPFAIDPTVVTDGFRVQGIETECTVAVYGVGGELVLQREHVKNNTFVNIAHVPEGMYIVVVSKDDDTHKQRILKVK